MVVITADLRDTDSVTGPDEVGATLPALPRNARAEVVRSLTVPDAVRAVADDSNDPAVCMATHTWGLQLKVVIFQLNILAASKAPPRPYEKWRAC